MAEKHCCCNSEENGNCHQDHHHHGHSHEGCSDEGHELHEMTQAAWIEAWEKEDKFHTGFHLKTVHPLLKNNIDKLTGGRQNLKVFVPLAGKTVDLKWLADQGHHVVGVEWAELAIRSFFKENSIKFTQEPVESVDGVLYKNLDGKIKFYCCDQLKFTRETEGQFDAIWDRGGIVGLNESDHERYASLIKSLLAPGSKCLVASLCIGAEATGKQWINQELLQKLYGDLCVIESLEGNFKECGTNFPTYVEKVFLLTPTTS